MTKTAKAMEGMIVAAHPLAAEAGRAILREGGNAVDAAVAVSLALGVVEPQASGLGGGGFMLVCPRGSEAETVVIDGRGLTPSLASEEHIYPRGVQLPWAPKTGPMSATIPGLGRLLEEALRRFGSGMPPAKLAAPALRLAEEGIRVGEVFVYCTSLFEATLRNSPAAARIFFKEGKRFAAGDTLRQPKLAETIRLVIREGFEALYSGEIGRAMMRTVNETGPVWGEEDLTRYAIRVRSPIRASIGEYRLATVGPPSRGGLGLLKTLEEMSRAPREPAARFLFLIDTLARVFRALDPAVGDPDVRKVDLDWKFLGDPPGPGGGTSHFTVVDREGTAVTMSQTIGHFFGSGFVVPEFGILLNNDISDMSVMPGHPNAIGASKRPVANMAPTILFGSGSRIALGSPGSLRILPALSCVLDYRIHQGLDLEVAIAAARIHWQEGTAYLEGHLDPEVRAEIRRGFSGPVVERRPRDLFFGGVHAVEVGSDGLLWGVADPRRDGVALGG